MQGDTYELGHRVPLDGLRGIAVLLVIAGHIHIDAVIGGGPIGVTLFFVLSGFLITRLLIEELRATGRINLRRFYIRRARRLLPAFAVFLAVMGGLFAATHAPFAPIWWSAINLGDYGRLAGIDMGYLGHTWSLSLEEQFYAVWPAMTLVMLRRKPIRWLLLAALVVTIVRLWLTRGEHGYYVHGYTAEVRADALILGCALAVASPRVQGLDLRRSSVMAACLYLAALPFAGYAVMLALTPVAAASALLVAYASQDLPPARFHRALSIKPLVRIGRISYGLYLWHYPVAVLVFATAGQEPSVVKTLVILIASLTLAWASWVLVERRFAGRRRAAPSTQAEPPARHAAVAAS